MIAPATLAQLLELAPLKRYLDAVEASLKTLFPDITVRQHPGRIDVSDIIEKDIFTPPMLAVAATRWKLDGDLDGSWALEIEPAVYIVTEDMAIGGRAVRRQEIAHALSQGVLAILGDLDAQRFGLTNIGSPQKVEARPLFTSEVYARGSAYYVATWSQTLSGIVESPLVKPAIPAPQITDFDGEPVDASDGAPV
ncbi:hypothetical protein IP86_10795 [Rhodopseudomonas sp. AAP120]|uniref:hypothetical protein n=1 Tax=Rhodopseudomonas sp. AAP120 TaxID=1523430 RepID=UPI0006BA035E|nr:hypothetical protein [Rhodopseudomonas sp. AAP120]KPF98809.1 hypothetical protein IP86_10795 [Rhodopseudomonas sp. AAP120]